MVRRAEQANYSLESVDRMAAILHTLELAPEQTLEQVARLAGLNESTALRYLLSLSKYELVERNETSGRFRLGLSLFRLGSRSIEYRDIVTVSLPVMERLLAQFGESVNLATRQQEQVMLLKVLESANLINVSRQQGRCMEITILPVSASASSSDPAENPEIPRAPR